MLVSGVAIFAVAAVALASVARRPIGPAASATPTDPLNAVETATPAPSATRTSGAAASQPGSPLPAGTFENAVLGYRITLPEGYRRGSSRIGDASAGPGLGTDTYTPSTTGQERERCLNDSGDVGFLTYARGDVNVSVSRNDLGISPFEWATTPQSPGGAVIGTHQRVERTTINGQEAARLVEDNARAATMQFVIAANGRMYWLHPSVMPLDGPASLEEIAQTFVAITPAALPAPTPTSSVAPREAAQAVAASLAAAFAAKDADGVARLMSDCWLFVSPLVNGQPAGGVQYRSVAQFTQGLRERLAKGDLTVTVDTNLLTNTRAEDMFYVRSEWKEPARTSVIHLYLANVGGRWIWYSAEPQDGWPCFSPWATPPSC